MKRLNALFSLSKNKLILIIEVRFDISSEAKFDIFDDGKEQIFRAAESMQI
jgi:hypothetical protein